MIEVQTRGVDYRVRGFNRKEGGGVVSYGYERKGDTLILLS